jgi:hypothetical protein
VNIPQGPPWVISGPQERVRNTSVYTPIADIGEYRGHVRKVPEADMRAAARFAISSPLHIDLKPRKLNLNRCLGDDRRLALALGREGSLG